MWTLYIPQVLLCLPCCLPQPHCRPLHLHSHFICLFTGLSNSEIISRPCGYFAISVSTSRLLTALEKPPVAHSSISKVPADLPFDLLLTMFPSQPLTIQLSGSAPTEMFAQQQDWRGISVSKRQCGLIRKLKLRVTGSTVAKKCKHNIWVVHKIDVSLSVIQWYSD